MTPLQWAIFCCFCFVTGFSSGWVIGQFGYLARHPRATPELLIAMGLAQTNKRDFK